jgi:hypothetical protein
MWEVLKTPPTNEMMVVMTHHDHFFLLHQSFTTHSPFLPTHSPLPSHLIVLLSRLSSLPLLPFILLHFILQGGDCAIELDTPVTRQRSMEGHDFAREVCASRANMLAAAPAFGVP